MCASDTAKNSEILRKTVPTITDQQEELAKKSVAPKIVYDYKNDKKYQLNLMPQHLTDRIDKMKEFKKPIRRADVEDTLPNYYENYRRFLNSFQQPDWMTKSQFTDVDMFSNQYPAASNMLGSNRNEWPPNINIQTIQHRRNGGEQLPLNEMDMYDLSKRFAAQRRVDNNGQSAISQVGLSNANDQTNIYPYPSTNVILRRSVDLPFPLSLPMLDAAFNFVKMFQQNQN